VNSRRPATVLRAVANWVNLSTPLGFAIAAVGRARVHKGPDHLWIAEGYRLGVPVAGAFTVGSVVIVKGRTLADLQTGTPLVLEHEATHAWQWAACLGLPFLPLYLLANAWSWARTRTWYAANSFEVWADLAKGGYAPAGPPQRMRRRDADRLR